MDIKSKLKQKRIRKYGLWAVGVLVVIGIVSALFTIEPPDKKLADGQGNVVVAAEDAEGAQDKASEKEKEMASDKQEARGNETLKKVAKLSDKEKKKITPKDIKVDNSKDPTASNDGNKALKPKKPQNVTVTIEIRCDRVAENMGLLENKSIESYIPKDGTILAKSTYKGTTENTVFDVLNTLCRNKNIQIEYEYTAGFDTYYVKGINYLYELDCGYESGWIFKVNGWVPNYGCSNYYLSDGDEIVWHYTCKGYGADI